MVVPDVHGGVFNIATEWAFVGWNLGWSFLAKAKLKIKQNVKHIRLLAFYLRFTMDK